LRCVNAHYKSVTSIVVTEDDGLLLTSGEDALVNVFVLATLLENQEAPPFKTLSGHGLSVTAIAVTPGGLHGNVVSASLDRSVKVWEIATGKMIRNFVLPTFANDVAVSCDSEKIFAACGDTRAYMLSVSGDEVLKFEGHSGPLMKINLSQDGQTLVTCAQGDSVRIWDVATRQCVRHLHTCFQNAQISSIMICHRTVAPSPMPEFKPLQRVVSSPSELPLVPVFARRASFSVDDSPIPVDKLEQYEEASELHKRIQQLETEQKRWAAASLSLYQTLIAKTEGDSEPMDCENAERLQEKQQKTETSKPQNKEPSKPQKIEPSKSQMNESSNPEEKRPKTESKETKRKTEPSNPQEKRQKTEPSKPKKKRKVRK